MARSATVRSAGKARGSFYRGGPGMLTWMLHRITGVLIFAFLFAHILDTAMVAVPADPAGAYYDGVVSVYHHPVIRLMEIGLVVAVVFHAMNGLRITIIDFWSQGTRRVRELTIVFMGLAFILSAGATLSMGKQIIDELRDEGGEASQ